MRLAWIALPLVVAAILVAVVAHAWHTGGPNGTVDVYDAVTGRHLWGRTAHGGFVVVLAVTPRAALVADASDCLHGKPGNIELLTASSARVVKQANACAVYRFSSTDDVDAHLSATRPATLVVQVPPQLGGGLVRLPCPCPKPAPSAFGNPGSPVMFGATTKVGLGRFVYGSD